MKHLEMFTGRIGRVEELREFGNQGGCVLNFSVAETPRYKKGDEWVDGTTIWTNVSIFGDEARNLQRSVVPGTFVTVVGERRANEYTVKDSNEKRTAQYVVATQVAVSITKFNFINEIGSINYRKDSEPTIASTGGQSAPQSKPASTPKDDPFAETTFDDDPFGNDDDPFGLN